MAAPDALAEIRARAAALERRRENAGDEASARAAADELAALLDDVDDVVERSVPASSQHGWYLLAVAELGRCTCGEVGVCSGDADGPGVTCALCAALDPEWPCPTLDEDADYPDPDRVTVRP